MTKEKVYLDTNIFIYAFEGDPISWGHLNEFFQFAEQWEKMIVTSELTLAEILAPSLTSRPNKNAFYQNLLLWSGLIDLRPITRSILIETARLREKLRLKLPDAIHIVTSQQAECRYFISRDKDGKRLPPEITHVQPDADSMKNLMEVLRA